jgi:hypothetical protein
MGPIPEMMEEDIVFDSVQAAKTGGNKAAVEIRNYFPETWLWELEKVG